MAKYKPPGLIGLLDAGKVYRQLDQPSQLYRVLDDGKPKFSQPPEKKKEDEIIKATHRHFHVPNITRRRGVGSTTSSPGIIVPPNTIVAGTGYFLLIGEDMTTVTGYTMPAAAGAFALTGQSADLKKTAAVSAYTGPGEVTGWGTAYGYWGLRAYTAAKIGANCIDVCVNSTGATGTLTTLVIGSDGYVNTSGVTLPIYINKIYDQAGTQHLTLDAGDRPILTASIVGGKPAIFFPESFPMRSATNAVALSQPFATGIICRSHPFVSTGMMVSDGTFNCVPLFQGGTNTISQTFNASVLGNYSGVTDNVLVSLISVANGTPSTLCVNGATPTSTGAVVGTNGIGTTNKFCIGGTDPGGVLYGGYIYEVIVKSGVVSAANQTALSTNQHAIGTGW